MPDDRPADPTRSPGGDRVEAVPAARSGRPPWVVRGRGWVVLGSVLLTLWMGAGLSKIRHDDDVFSFLPPSAPEVRAFEEVSTRFGVLSVALVGLGVEADGSFWMPSHVEEVRELTRELRTLRGVAEVLSFPDLPEAKVEGETLVVDVLVPEGVDDPATIRDRVSSSPNAVGNLVTADGRAAALLIELLDGGERADVLQRVRDVVSRRWRRGEVRFAGAPFVEQEAASGSRRDIARLSPVVIAVLVVASAVLLGSLWGALINLVVTSMGVVWVMGALGWLGEPLSIVSGTLPVLLVAFGGAFGMHLISGYQRRSGTPAERAAASRTELGAAVALSGVTTACAFAALVVMPQVPMQRFGIVAASGVGVLLAQALWVMPALLSSLPSTALGRRSLGAGRSWVVGAWWAGRPGRRRRLVMVCLAAALAGVVGAVGLRAASQTTRMFDEDSDVRRAERFFAEHFGGSEFVQIMVEGDLDEPMVLWWIDDLVRSIAATPGVVDVRSLLEPVGLVTEGFGGRPGIPSTPQRARRVLTSLADQPPMAQLMTVERDAALIHVRIAATDDPDGVLDALKRRLDEMRTDVIRVGDASLPEVAGARAAAIEHKLARFGERRRVNAIPGGDARELSPALRREIVAAIHRAISTDELIEPRPAADAAALDAAEVARAGGAGELATLVRRVLPALETEDPEGVEIVAEQLSGWVAEARGRLRAEDTCRALGVPADASTGRCREISGIVAAGEDPEWAIPEGGDVGALREVPISVRMTGAPWLGRAFARSVAWSLAASTAISVVVIVIVLSLAGIAVAVVPALSTLGFTLGGLAWVGHEISVGTSMITCMAIGAGVDFAIHLLARARRTSVGDACATLGPVILITGLQLALAFCVLSASSMPPLRQFGVGLAMALLIAAIAALALIPLLSRETGRGRSADPP